MPIPSLRLDSGYSVSGARRPRLKIPLDGAQPDAVGAPAQDGPAPLQAAAAPAEPTPTTTPASPAPRPQALSTDVTSLIRPRSLSPAVQGLADSYLGKLNAAPVTSDQVMGSQEYQERVKPIDLAAGMAQADIRASLASRGMLRSTPAIQALASSDAYYAAQKGAMASNLIDSAQARQQQSLGNARSAMGDMANLDNTAFNQGVTEFQTTAPYTRLTKGQEQDIAFRESDLTGRYLSPAARGLADSILKAKAGNPLGQDPAAAQQAQDARSQLSAMGYDAGLLGGDVTVDQARQNMSKLGMQSPDMAFKEASVTGRYLPPGVRDLYNQVLQLKQQNTGGQNTGAAQQADALRGQIAAAGYDPSLVGSDVALTDAQQNMGMAGAPTIQGQMLGLQAQRERLANEVATMQLAIDKDPNYGLNAQARVGLQLKQKQLQHLDSQIANQNSLANNRGAAGAKGGITAYEQYQIDRNKAKDQSDSRTKAVQGLTKEYTVSDHAAEIWLDVADLMKTPKPDGSMPTFDEVNGLLQEGVPKSGLSPDDQSWVMLKFGSANGNSDHGAALDRTFKRKKLKP